MKTPPTLRRVKRSLDHDGLATVLTTIDAGLHQPVDGTSPPIAFGLRGVDGDGFDIEATALDGEDPVASLLGFSCPDDWLAFGVITPGRAHRLEPAAPPFTPPAEAVRVGLLVSRSGGQVSLIRQGDGPAEITSGAPAQGRLPDVCRRALGLSTAPATEWSGLVWALVWVENLLAESLADPGALTWAEAVRLHPTVAYVLGLDSEIGSELPHRFVEMVQIVSRRVGWAEVRALASAGTPRGFDITPEHAAWMDDGMFSREVIGGFAPLATMLLELEHVAAPDVRTSVEHALDAWGAG